MPSALWVSASSATRGMSRGRFFGWGATVSPAFQPGGGPWEMGRRIVYRGGSVGTIAVGINSVGKKSVGRIFRMAGRILDANLKRVGKNSRRNNLLNPFSRERQESWHQSVRFFQTPNFWGAFTGGNWIFLKLTGKILDGSSKWHEKSWPKFLLDYFGQNAM